jgi:hypothetical protein
LEDGVPQSKVSDEQIEQAVAAAENMAHLLRMLGVVPCGGNYETFRARLRALDLLDELRARGFHATYRTARNAARRLDLDLATVPGQAWRKGSRVPVRRARPLDEVLVIGTRPGGSDLRRRLVREGLLDER